jgi:hypothetical protein
LFGDAILKSTNGIRFILLSLKKGIYIYIKAIWIGWFKYITQSVILRKIKKLLINLLGSGVHKYNVGMRDLKSFYSELMDKRPGIIEDVIVQHQNMNLLSPYSVNTVRIVTINRGGKCHIAYATQRMGRCENIYVDNAGSGGIFAVVDPNSGQIVTDGVCENGDSFAQHPLTKTAIRSFQIPHWAEVLELIKEVYNKIPNINLVGWDIAISNKGPVVVEANITCPGAELLQMPYILAGVGCRKKLEWFFK